MCAKPVRKNLSCAHFLQNHLHLRSLLGVASAIVQYRSNNFVKVSQRLSLLASTFVQHDREDFRQTGGVVLGERRFK